MFVRYSKVSLLDDTFENKNWDVNFHFIFCISFKYFSCNKQIASGRQVLQESDLHYQERLLDELVQIFRVFPLANMFDPQLLSEEFVSKQVGNLFTEQICSLKFGIDTKHKPNRYSSHLSEAENTTFCQLLKGKTFPTPDQLYQPHPYHTKSIN